MEEQMNFLISLSSIKGNWFTDSNYIANEQNIKSMSQKRIVQIFSVWAKNVKSIKTQRKTRRKHLEKVTFFYLLFFCCVDSQT